MKRVGILFGILFLAGGVVRAAVTIPPANEVLAKLRLEHPRLLARSNDFVRLKERVATDAQLKAWLEKLRGEGEKVLGEEPSQYEIPDGLRLLSVSRRVVHRMQLLGLLYRLDGEARWRELAWKELEAAAQFKDWNPRHFLDTAEMTHAFAIGYDWFYDGWSAEQRAILRQAMVEKGIKLALQLHREKRGWTQVRHNWNQVCNGGIGMGALALLDEEPEVAGEFLQAALRSIQLPMAEFAPDGAWAEGPGYWDYATSYNVYFLAGLETALGTDFGLSGIRGFSEAGTFPVYGTGPLNRTFNYADSGDGAVRAPQLFWMAKRFGRLEYAAYERRMAAPKPLDVLWYEAGPEKGRAGENALPLDRYFRGAEVVTFRSAWEGRDGVFVGFKAGDNKANHSHLDLGSFVLDALGKRWAVDLGGDDYNLPGYFGKERWTYYRLRAEGQNALVIGGGEEPDQDPSAAGRMERFETRPERVFAIANLTKAYAKRAQSVQRGVALLDRERVLIQDEVSAEASVEAWWFMHTQSEIEISADGRTAILKHGDARLRAEVLSPAGVRFEVMAAAPLPGSPKPERQNANAGTRKLSVRVGGKEFRLAILLTPVKEQKAIEQAVAVKALADW